MRFRSLKTAAIALALGAAAAGISSQAPAEPVEYVKVCSLYGAGFFYIPGTDTCIRIEGGVEGGYGWTGREFRTDPPFNVDGSGGVGGLYGGGVVGVPGANVGIGARAGVIYGDMRGRIDGPPASPGFDYTGKTRSMTFIEAEFIRFAGFTVGRRSESFFDSVSWMGVEPYVTVGAARIDTRIIGTSGAFSVTDSHSVTAFTASVGINIPLGGNLYGTGQLRGIWGGSHTFNIPGAVQIDQRDTYIATFGIKVVSDARLKRDVARVGELDNGLGLYRYRYLWSDQLYVGVMAQEVAEVVPDAVVRGADGYLRVNYAKLGLQLQTWEAWSGSH